MKRSAVCLLLAVAVALASPMWCCCAIGFATDSLLGIAQCSAAETRCASAPAPKRACCADDSDEESPCRCSDRPSELLVLDTAGKLTLPKIDSAGVAVAAEHRAASEVPARCVSAILRHEPAHPPPRTLLAQRCLLLL